MGGCICPDSSNSVGMGIPAYQSGLQCLWHHGGHDGQQNALCRHTLCCNILGVAPILISIYFMFFSQRTKLPTTKSVQVGAGTLSGLMGGFFGMQGPPAVLYFIQSEPTKEHYMAMAQTYFFIGNVMMTGVRAYNGFFTTTVAIDYLYGLGGVIIGTLLGAYVFKHIPNHIFRYIVYAYICFSGVIILITN